MGVLNQGVWTQLDQLDQVDSFPTQTVPESGRYHLYISLACPWANRANLVLHYLGLKEAISVSSVDPKMVDGWRFSEEYPDPFNHAQYLRDIYTRAKADFTGRVTVPVLWDKTNQTIASHDSAQLALELAEKWLPFAKTPRQLVPSNLRADILALNDWLTPNINRKVYNVGLFAQSQAEYEQHHRELFENLAILDERLNTQKYLFGDEITLSDFFLFPTLIRFEAVYALHFKCNLKPLKSFNNLYRYMLDLYALPEVRATIDVPHIKTHYYYSHDSINPTRIIPLGPELEWLAP